MSYVNLKGTFQAGNVLSLNTSNSALRYGFGLLETMLVQDGRILLEPYHWERLFEGMKKLEFDTPAHFTSDHLQQQVLGTASKNRLEKLCKVRLQVFTEMDSLFSHDKKQPQFLIECFPLEKAVYEWNETGWTCGVAENAFKNNDAYSNLKTSNSLIYIMAALQAKKNKWNDALICNADKNIIESTIANIFWVKDEKLYTPSLSEGCIAGVMRRHLIHECRYNNIPVTEAPLHLNTLSSADEVFLTNAIRRIKWIKQIQQCSYKNFYSKYLYARLF